MTSMYQTQPHKISKLGCSFQNLKGSTTSETFLELKGSDVENLGMGENIVMTSVAEERMERDIRYTLK